MKFTRLRLIGFKSFVEPTDVLIEPGLTGVVGPNGCGKSNLVEALRWVMGESSHKAMRASDMEDVIFAGSGNRPARNMAEVAISIDNSDRTAPAAFNDQEALDISRRIERDAGSTYRVNHREVRARDVHLLFADASTGSRSPALVHQGRIGEIIQAKPAQRRAVLEEAAGISGLHARRHEAELRLRAAEHNLERIEDVIGQLTAQIDALKRQARQAIRYRTVSAEVRKAEAMLYHLRFIAANAEVAEAGQVKDQSVRLVAERTGAQAEAARRQALAAAELPGLRDAEAAAAAALHRLQLARDSLEREETRARERMAELDRRLTQFAEDIAREQKLAADADEALARLASEEQTLSAEAQAAATRRAGVDQRVAEAESVLGEAEARFGDLTSALAELTARRHQLEDAARRHTQRLERIAAEVSGVEAEIAKLEAEQQSGPDLQALGAAVAAAQAAVAEAEAASIAAETAHGQARDGLDAARSPLAEAERRVQRLETEAKTLSKVLAVETKNLWPPVMDSITVDKGYEAALGTALGDDLDAPTDPSSPMRWVGSELDPSDPALPEGAVMLADYVQAPPELARRLRQIGVVDKADGPRLAAQLKPGQRLVSRDGDLWRWDGFAADAHAPTGAARRLAQRSRLADISAELESARAELESRRTALAAAQQALSAAAAGEAEARALARERQHGADSARNSHAAAERDVSRNAARLSALAEAKARLNGDGDEAQHARTDSEQALAALPPAADLESRLATVRSEIENHRSAVAEIRAEAQAIAREAELSNRRLQAIAVERQSWDDRRSSAASQIATLETRSEEARSERSSLEDAPAAFAEKRQAMIGEIEAAEAERRAAADRLAEAESALAAADSDAKTALEALSAAREEAARAEERHEAARRRLADMAHEIEEILEVEPARLAGLAGIEADTVLPEASAVEERLDKLRRDRERLGAVNLRAEEELREVEAQHTALTTERDDLVEAIRKLRHGIQSLNREARERLLTSFEVVNGHFRQLFSGLFGGGTAELQLIEAEDPLEAGLEIMVTPPGKKRQTLSLLSGGEQALTALALIFAVFLTNPAPICVLDEVDAPLDDHNVERFCDLLDEMAKSTATRFIIITHNPITMARMNRLYGVTMAERGVSQLVSVDLEGAVKLREAS